MKKTREIAVIVSCVLLYTGSATVANAGTAGPEAAKTNDTELAEVVVTGSKLNPSKITVITAAEIKAKGAENAAEALKEVAGLSVTGNNTKGKGYGQFRGSDANSTKVFVDGVMLSSVGDGRVDLRSIPADNIEKIEVIKGPAPVVYGTDAVGGVIYITTKTGSNKASNAISMARGSWDTERYSVSVGGDTGKFNYLIGIKTENSDGYTVHSGVKADYYNGKFSWALNPKASLTLFGSYSEAQEQIPNRLDAAGNKIINAGRGGALSQQNSYFTGTYDWEYDSIKRSYIGAVYNQKLNNDNDISLKIYQSNEKSLLSTSGYQSLYWDGRVEGYELQHIIRTSRINTVTSGYAYEKRDFVERTSNRDGTYNRADYDYTGKSFYMQDVFNVNPRLDASLGYRHNKNTDYISAMPWQMTYRDAHGGMDRSDDAVFSLRYKLSGHTALYGSIGTSYRFPNAQERSALGGIYEGVPCDYLLPEEALNRELGLSHALNSGLSLDVTYFNKDITNMIKSTGQGQGRNQYFNIPDVDMHGYEVEISQKINNHVNGYFNCSYTNAFDTLVKQQVRDVPYRTYSYGLNYAEKDGINANLAVRYIGQRKSLFNNGNGNGNGDGQNYITPVDLAGYRVVDLKISKAINDKEYFVKVQNLFDKRYYQGAYLIGPGRYVEVGTNIRF